MRLFINYHKHLNNFKSWSRRMGHSPVKGSPSHTNNNSRAMPRSTSQQRVVPQASNIYPVDVAEWIFEPRRSSSKSATQTKSDMLKGPVTFRTWDFDGIKQVIHNKSKFILNFYSANNFPLKFVFSHGVVFICYSGK